MILYLCRLLFAIIDVFNVKRYFLWFFVIIYLCILLKNIFIIISSMNKWGSWLKTIKRKILGYKKFKIFKNLFGILKF